MNQTDIEILKAKLTALGLAGKLADKLNSLAESSFCIHHSWGLGEIKAYLAGEDRIVVDFPDAGKVDHKMAPQLCLEKCEILPANHILARFKNDPAPIKNLEKSNRVELVKQILASSSTVKLTDINNQAKIVSKKDLEKTLAGIDPVNRPTVTMVMTSSEIESILLRIVGRENLKKWWSAAKKELSRNEYIGVPAKKDGYYELREEGQTVSPERELLDEYMREKKLLRKIQLLEKLFAFSATDDLPKARPGEPQPLHAYRSCDADVASRLHDVFLELTDALSEESTARLKPADRLYGVWVRNDLCRFFKEDVDSLAPTSASIIRKERDEGKLSDLAAAIPQDLKCLKRLLDLLSRIYKEPVDGGNDPEWVEVITDLLEKSTGKFTGECVLFLYEHKKANHVYDTLKAWLDEQKLTSSVLIWICKNRNNPKYKDGLKPLITHRLLSAIFYAIDQEAIKSNSTKKILLAEEVRQDNNLISDLLADADESTARDLAQMLKMTQGFAELTRKAILARFIRVYSSIQDLVDGQATAKSNTLYVSAGSHARKTAEYEHLVKVEIPANKAAIAAAKELGDLSENSEYKMAREDATVLAARQVALQKELSLAHVVDFSDATSDKVSIGSVVEIRSASGTTERYAIMGAWDSNPSKKILQYMAPLAQKLIGKIVGDELTIGDEIWSIVEISRWIDHKDEFQIEDAKK